jgi:hypothetical protein
MKRERKNPGGRNKETIISSWLLATDYWLLEQDDPNE